MERWPFLVRSLPGDIRVERENLRVHIPLVSMLIVSVVASILLSLFRR